jgi:hypothetical protein
MHFRVYAKVLIDESQNISAENFENGVYAMKIFSAESSSAHYGIRYCPKHI